MCVDKLHGSQSLSTTDGDNLSVCTTDTDEFRYVARRDKPQLDSLVVEAVPPSAANQSMALPSPASTIESLTREFQDSLELSHSRYASSRCSLSLHESRSSERASDSSRSSAAAPAAPDAPDPRKEASAPRSEPRDVRTHSEGRSSQAAPRQPAARRSNSESLGGARRRSAGDEAALGLALRTRTVSGQQLSDIEILEQVTVLNLDTGRYTLHPTPHPHTQQLARAPCRGSSCPTSRSWSRSPCSTSTPVGTRYTPHPTPTHSNSHAHRVGAAAVRHRDPGAGHRAQPRHRSVHATPHTPPPHTATRTRTVSGQQLSDIEILEQVTVLNLDTGRYTLHPTPHPHTQQLARAPCRGSSCPTSRSWSRSPCSTSTPVGTRYTPHPTPTHSNSHAHRVGAAAVRHRDPGAGHRAQPRHRSVHATPHTPPPHTATRTRTVSGQQLSDIEILEQVTVLNLDTGRYTLHPTPHPHTQQLARAPCRGSSCPTSRSWSRSPCSTSTPVGTRYTPHPTPTHSNSHAHRVGAAAVRHRDPGAGHRAQPRHRSVHATPHTPPPHTATRTRTVSGQQLSDIEILEQVTVLNLDTGRNSHAHRVGAAAVRHRDPGAGHRAQPRHRSVHATPHTPPPHTATRTRTVSGQQLSDIEILEQVTVLNLDTGRYTLHPTPHPHTQQLARAPCRGSSCPTSRSWSRSPCSTSTPVGTRYTPHPTPTHSNSHAHRVGAAAVRHRDPGAGRRAQPRHRSVHATPHTPPPHTATRTRTVSGQQLSDIEILEQVTVLNLDTGRYTLHPTPHPHTQQLARAPCRGSSCPTSRSWSRSPCSTSTPVGTRYTPHPTPTHSNSHAHRVGAAAVRHRDPGAGHRAQPRHRSVHATPHTPPPHTATRTRTVSGQQLSDIEILEQVTVLNLDTGRYTLHPTPHPHTQQLARAPCRGSSCPTSRSWSRSPCSTSTPVGTRYTPHPTPTHSNSHAHRVGAAAVRHRDPGAGHRAQPRHRSVHATPHTPPPHTATRTRTVSGQQLSDIEILEQVTVLNLDTGRYTLHPTPHPHTQQLARAPCRGSSCPTSRSWSRSPCSTSTPVGTRYTPHPTPTHSNSHAHRVGVAAVRHRDPGAGHRAQPRHRSVHATPHTPPPHTATRTRTVSGQQLSDIEILEQVTVLNLDTGRYTLHPTPHPHTQQLARAPCRGSSCPTSRSWSRSPCSTSTPVGTRYTPHPTPTHSNSHAHRVGAAAVRHRDPGAGRRAQPRHRSVHATPHTPPPHTATRTRTVSGQQLSDIEILEQVTVLNLDTGRYTLHPTPHPHTQQLARAPCRGSSCPTSRSWSRSPCSTSTPVGTRYTPHPTPTHSNSHAHRVGAAAVRHRDPGAGHRAQPRHRSVHATPHTPPPHTATRTRTVSGQQLSDIEILEQVAVLNLDTGRYTLHPTPHPHTQQLARAPCRGSSCPTSRSWSRSPCSTSTPVGTRYTPHPTPTHSNSHAHRVGAAAVRHRDPGAGRRAQPRHRSVHATPHTPPPHTATRTRTVSGQQLSDIEILEQVAVLNLDTGRYTLHPTPHPHTQQLARAPCRGSSCPTSRSWSRSPCSTSTPVGTRYTPHPTPTHSNSHAHRVGAAAVRHRDPGAGRRAQPRHRSVHATPQEKVV
ncbi:hypothetical protein PYW07_016788 [Mythimna separata]|uniref:Uncharacterized protein n=1 Tax=Mythimna separata TaxID=271217 RepID=A0AAD7YL44_MYTSE|nr:hypothetical protein PYW07_016788 [Mythimna separata]